MTRDRFVRTVCAAAALVVVASCGRAADYPYMVEGAPHAEAIVAALAREWNADELIKQMDPKLLAPSQETNFRELVATCSRELGRPRNQKTLLGSSGINVGVPPGKYAEYVIELQCEKATQQVKIRLRKVSNDWTVIGFWVGPSPATAASTSPGAPNR